MNDITHGYVQGKMLLYRQPEMLSREQHAGLGISAIAAPHGHTRDVQAVPVTVTEFVTAAKNFPIVFASVEQPVPLAILGVVEKSNLFIDEAGNWDSVTYVPAYIRCYPFALAQHGDDQLAMVIDRSAEAINDQPERPFFDGDEVSTYVNQMTEFCARYQQERKRTEAFCQRLVELDLLTAQHVSYTPLGETEQQTLASYVSIDANKLTDLDAEVIHDLHKTGQLAAIYAQVNSMENWNMLLARRQMRQS